MKSMLRHPILNVNMVVHKRKTAHAIRDDCRCYSKSDIKLNVRVGVKMSVIRL